MRFIRATILGLLGPAFLTTAACNQLGGGGQQAVDAFLPDDITLEIEEVPEDNSAGKIIRFQDAGSEDAIRYNRSVKLSANIVHAFQRFASGALELGSSIREDMVDPTQTQVQGAFTVNGVEVAYKADFAPFDIDGDGDLDGSGQAGVEPVSLRIWVDRGEGFMPFLAALVTTRPSAANIGAGEIFVRPNAADSTAFADLQLFVEWDRTDETHRWNEAVIVGQVREETSISSGRQRVDVRTYDDGSLEKTIRSSNNLLDNPYDFETFVGAAHYQRGGTTMLISAQATGAIIPIGFTEVCVDLTTKMPVAEGGCDGFDTQDMNYVNTPEETEADFPADFPSMPTF